MKKIVIAAGSGYLGSVLIEQLKNKYDEFVVLTRGGEKTNGKIKFINWDAKSAGPWQTELENATALVNLVGKNVNCRYTTKNKKEILESRINATQILGETISQLKNPPQVWINAASATIYEHSETTPMTEANGKIGEGFSVEICKAWEKKFFEFKHLNTRQICLRVGMVLGNGGGVFPVLKRLTKLGLGGTMGKGTQMVSWIDENDFTKMVQWAIENKNVNGIYNCTAPVPLTNKASAQLLCKKLNVKLALPATKWMLELGAFLIRTEPELVLKSRFVIPERAEQGGFNFDYKTFEDCLNHLIKN